MKKSINLKSLALATVLFSVNATTLMASGEGELVQNGSFENFTVNKDHGKWKEVQFTNWSGDGEAWNHKIGRIATKGTYKAELDAGKNVDTLSQSITTVAGEKYTFSVDAYARKAGTSDFELLIDGQVISKITPSKYWEKYGVEFTATGGEQTIAIRELSSQNNRRGTVIDNVSIQSGLSLDQLKAKERALVEIIEPTGLNQIQEVIRNDTYLNAKISAEDIEKANEAATRMNELIFEAVRVNGLANDGVISVADTMEINLYLVKKYADEWETLRADYKLIEKRGRITALNTNAVRNVWGKIYNLGFESTNNARNTTSIEGKKGSSFRTVGYLLGSVMKFDAQEGGTLNNADFQEVAGTTDTKLDMIINVILTDRGLLRKVPTSDLRAGAKSADAMNHLIVEAIKAEGLGNDKKLTTADIRTINNYLVANHAEKWAELHGDDEDGEETGYHRIQNDGATTRLQADNLMNTVADGIYHLGFETNRKDRLLNEDGNANQRFEKVAWWLDSSLKQDLKEGKFANTEYKEVEGETGTSFDKIIPYIYSDEGLIYHVSMEDIREGARTANEMNKLIVEGIKTTGIANDDYISIDDVKTLNTYLVTNYASEWAELHGDDEDNEETGYHRIQNDGAVGVMNNRNTINNLADGIYHLGFPTRFDKNLENEDGNKNVSFASVSYWLNKSLKNDFLRGTLK